MGKYKVLNVYLLFGAVPNAQCFLYHYNKKNCRNNCCNNHPRQYNTRFLFFFFHNYLSTFSFNLTFYFLLIMLNIILKSQNIRIKNVFLSPFDSFVCFYLQLYNHVIIIPLPLFSFYNKHKTLIKPENIYCKYWNTIGRTIAITNIIHITAAIFCWFFLLKKFI